MIQAVQWDAAVPDVVSFIQPAVISLQSQSACLFVCLFVRCCRWMIDQREWRALTALSRPLYTPYIHRIFIILLGSCLLSVRFVFCQRMKHVSVWYALFICWMILMSILAPCICVFHKIIHSFIRPFKVGNNGPQKNKSFLSFIINDRNERKEQSIQTVNHTT